MTLGTIAWLTLLGLIAWYWWHAKAIKDHVLQAAKVHCKRMDVLLLDEAVYLRGIWFKRDEQGKLRVWRRFMFDFTTTGEERYLGRVITLGKRITHIELEPHRIGSDFY